MTSALLYSGAARQMARNLARDAADGLYLPAKRAVLTAEHLLLQLEEAGASKSDRDQLRDWLLDTFSNVQAGIDRVLDAEGITAETHQVDISELKGSGL